MISYSHKQGEIYFVLILFIISKLLFGFVEPYEQWKIYFLKNPYWMRARFEYDMF